MTPGKSGVIVEENMMPGVTLSRWTMSYFFAALSALIADEVLMLAGFGYPAAGLRAPETLVMVHESDVHPDRTDARRLEVKIHSRQAGVCFRNHEFADRHEAAVSPLAERLFGIPGVAAIEFSHDCIIVTKTAGDWQHLKPALLGTIMEHFMSNTPVMRPARKTQGGKDGESSAFVNQIMASLREVIDPQLGYNIVDLGLIYDVVVEANGVTTVAMTTTTPGCPATNYLKQGVHDRTAAVEGARKVEVDLTYEPRWEPEMMSPAAKQRLGVY